MIKLNEIEIIGNSKTLKYYRSLGYIINHGEKIKINIIDLISTSSIKIECYCDLCNGFNNIKYYNYTGNINRNGIYICNECSKYKRIVKIKEIFKDDKKKIEIINKVKKTKFENYGSSTYINVDKIKKTNLKRYGVEYPLQCKDIMDKVKKTNLEKYDVEFVFLNKNIKSKAERTILQKYGVENPFQNEEIKSKIRKKLIEKYGVDNPTKNIDIFNRSQKSSLHVYKHEKFNLTYQGSYELDFINFCVSKDIELINGPTIDYIIEGKNRKYHSDFFIPSHNLICEVKSNWTMKRDYIENQCKMEFSIKNGYNFLFILDKDYEEFKNYLNI